MESCSDYNAIHQRSDDLASVLSRISRVNWRRLHGLAHRLVMHTCVNLYMYVIILCLGVTAYVSHKGM